MTRIQFDIYSIFTDHFLNASELDSDKFSISKDSLACLDITYLTKTQLAVSLTDNQNLVAQTLLRVSLIILYFTPLMYQSQRLNLLATNILS